MIGQSADESFAYVLGVYLGDGSVTEQDSGTRTFLLGSIDHDFTEATAEAFRELTDATVSVNGPYEPGKPGREFWQTYCGCDELCTRLEEDTDGKQVIPDYVWDWPEEVKIAFIEGLMDSEGFVAQKTATPDVHNTNRSFYMGYKSCDPWVRDFAELLADVGIRIGKISEEEPRKPGYKTPVRFHVKMQTWVDSGARFNIARKQDRVDRWAACEPYSERRPRS